MNKIFKTAIQFNKLVQNFQRKFDKIREVDRFWIALCIIYEFLPILCCFSNLFIYELHKNMWKEPLN